MKYFQNCLKFGILIFLLRADLSIAQTPVSGVDCANPKNRLEQTICKNRQGISSAEAAAPPPVTTPGQAQEIPVSSQMAEGYERSVRKKFREAIISSCGSAPTFVCINNSIEVKATVKQMCGAVQGQDRSRCLEIATDTANKAISPVVGSIGQRAAQQARVEEAREVQAIEQRRQADMKMEQEKKEQQRQRQIQEEQRRLQLAQQMEEQRRREEQQRIDDVRRREAEWEATRAKDDVDKRRREAEWEATHAKHETDIKNIKAAATPESKIAATLDSKFYRNMIEDTCNGMWSELKKSKEHIHMQAVRKASSVKICGCTKEWLPKVDITRDYLKEGYFEKLEVGMKKGKFEDLSADNQGIHSAIVGLVATVYERCAIDFARRGN